MAATSMMLRSIPELNEPEVRTMYRILHNLVEKATIQHVVIDRQALTGTERYDTRTTSSWSKRAQPSQSTRERVPAKNHIREIRDA